MKEKAKEVYSLFTYRFGHFLPGLKAIEEALDEAYEKGKEAAALTADSQLCCGPVIAAKIRAGSDDIHLPTSA